MTASSTLRTPSSSLKAGIGMLAVRQTTIVAFVTAVLLTILAAGQAAAAVSWTAQVPVSRPNRENCGQALAARATTSGRLLLHAVYASGVDRTFIVYRRSADHGATFPTAVLLAAGSGPKSCPVVAASSSIVAVVWFQWGANHDDPSLLLRVSTTNGLTFGPARRIPTPKGGFTHFHSVAVVGSRIVVAWSATVSPEGPWGVPRVAVSGDHGIHWLVRALDAKPGYGTRVAASGSRVFAAWLRDPRTLVGRFSVTGGMSWQSPKVLGALPAGPNAAFAIAARPDRAAIAWTGAPRTPDEQGPKLFVRSFAGGAWRTPVTLTATRPPPDHYFVTGTPSVMLLGSTRIGVAFTACHEFLDPGPRSCGDTYPKDDVLWAESTNNGATWSGPSVASKGGQTVGGMEAWSAIPSAVWPSSRSRAILISRHSPFLTGGRVFLVRGSS
jgi:hypothetical protein